MKERLDLLLVIRNLAGSREKAKTIIKSGNVYVNGKMVDKASSMFEEDVNIEIKDNPLKYVSRGGLKLEKALDSFKINLEGKTCMDVGASTGGFTDCMLQRGAKKVYSVDVGSDQLDSKLREDDRVISMEKTNIRYLTPEQIKDEIEFISVDVSFISLTKVLEPIRNLLIDRGELVALIKPQFEAGPENLGKRGVVKDKKAHIKTINNVSMFAHGIGFKCISLDFSPIKGPEGNIEYLIYLVKDNNNDNISDANIEYPVKESNNNISYAEIGLPLMKIEKVVEEAHKSLKQQQ